MRTVSVILACSFVASCLAMNCFNKTDGVYERSCRAFTRCIGGEAVIIECQHDEAFNQLKNTCEDKWTVPPPCGTYRECSDSDDGRYPDIETSCSSFYTCYKTLFLGHTLCPADLVYNKEKDTCDFKDHVAPPCGTRGTNSTRPEE